MVRNNKDIINWTDLAGKTITGYYNQEYDTYSTTISKKNEKGKYDNMYVNLFFSKKVNTREIKVDRKSVFELTVKSGWVSFYKDKIQLFINEIE